MFYINFYCLYTWLYYDTLHGKANAKNKLFEMLLSKNVFNCLMRNMQTRYLSRDSSLLMLLL